MALRSCPLRFEFVGQPGPVTKSARVGRRLATMIATTIQHTTTLVTEECCTCGMVFAMPEHFQKQMRKTKAYFHCPNGHAQHYNQSDADKLRKELEVTERRLATARESETYWRKESDRIDRSRNAIKGVLTKTKNRISKGACPCCNRCFTPASALQRHLETKHPGWVQDFS